MNILAIDTAGKTAAVAVMRDDTLLYEMASNTGLTHSETLLPMVDTALKACGLTPAQLDLYGRDQRSRAALPGCASVLPPSRGWLLRPTPPAPGFPPWLPWLTACAGKAL